MTTDKSTNVIAGDRARDLTADVTAKTRLCLKCRSSFESAGAGERVCRKCKPSSAWRGGKKGPVRLISLRLIPGDA